MKPFLFVLLGALGCGMSFASDFRLASTPIQAPVVHSGRFHVLTCGRTSVVLDGTRGMMIALIGDRAEDENAAAAISPRVRDLTLRVELRSGTEVIKTDQANDPSPRLQIISQGPTHVASRVFFVLNDENGRSFGTGTMDVYVYEGRVNLVPSVFIDDCGPQACIERAGLFLVLSRETWLLEAGDKPIADGQKKWFQGFGTEDSDFNLTAEEAGGKAMRMGWRRNLYPQFLYLRQIARNPEREELYEKWPPWVSQRGSPLGWKLDEESGMEVEKSEDGSLKLAFLWVRQKRPIPRGSYQAFNAPLAVVMGRTREEAESLWSSFAKPVKPVVSHGDFRFYNDLEGVYEVDSLGGPVDLTFDGTGENFDRVAIVRLWNLTSRGAYLIEADGKSVPFSLMNDGELIEDPMVFIIKQATGRARQAVVSLIVSKGKRTRFTLTSRPGLQLIYQMYSDLETYEAWSDQTERQPLFRFHLRELAIYQATLPGKSSYAFFKLPLFLMKNGVNPATFMNHLRQFKIEANGPEEILFSLRSVNLQETGLSFFSCRVPYRRECMTFEITAEFLPLDEGERWTSLEYCDLYPFEDVYRRNFHYQDVIFLTQDGLFDKVGAGAWAMRFESVDEPDRLGYYANYVSSSGPGSTVPHPRDGSIWILGNNTERGNILFRRGDWAVSAEAEPSFALCNAWMDVHNVILRPKERRSREKLSYVLEIFPGSVPSLEALNAFYRRDVGQGQAIRVRGIRYSNQGEMVGFIPEKGRNEKF